MRELNYYAEKAVAYARQWALSRNPKYYNFESFELGGDCTNFVSQCLFAGTGIMNYTKNFGWYYINLNNRGPAWTSVELLYTFLINNNGPGPFGMEMPIEQAEPGDIIQLSFNGGKFSHSLFVVEAKTGNPQDILLACHTYDALDKPLAVYSYAKARLIKIIGVRA